MLFWHLGATLFLFRWIFRDPKVDVRFLLVGAVLPDLVDLPLGTLVLSSYATGELWAHSLIAAALYIVVVLLMTRRGRGRRAWMAIGIGWLFHLLLDAMWLDQQIFLWPFFGVDLPSGPAPFWSLAWERAVSDPWRWLMELAGIGYLSWLWVTHHLRDPRLRRAFWETGRLDEVEAHPG